MHGYLTREDIAHYADQRGSVYDHPEYQRLVIAQHHYMQEVQSRMTHQRLRLAAELRTQLATEG